MFEVAVENIRSCSYQMITLRFWGQFGEAGALAAGDEAKHDFGGDENGDDSASCDYCDFHKHARYD